MKPWSLVAALSLTVLLGSADAQEKVKASYLGTSGGQTPLWIASDLGLFKKHGLQVDVVYIPGGAIATQALIANEIQFVLGQGFTSIVAALSGADPVIVGTFYNKNPYSFVTSPRIAQPADLMGKKIGVLSIGSVNSLVVEMALKHWKIDESKVFVLRAGSTRERVQSVTSGNLDATVVTAEEVKRVRKAGLKILLDLSELGSSLPMTSVTVRKSFVKTKTDIVARFLRATSEAGRILQTDKERSLKVLAKWTRLSDREALEDMYEIYSQTISLPPKTDLVGVQMILDFLGKSRPEARQARAQEFMDEGVLLDLEKAGFFRSMKN
ncbi:MAG: ABC transporter substrate-binding protein [Deltaproteobacteria bacterium]|nr:ABC transporter substrate-binding protein [Deltaproteobacteria bacterium]